MPDLLKTLEKMFSRGSRRRAPEESLSVKIYNKDRNGELFKVEEGCTCEQICLRIGKKLNISPAMLHSFALKKYSGDKQTWLSPWEKMNMETEVAQFHFRMRFIPTRMKESNGFHSKHIDDSGCLVYLFWQINWDFHHAHLEYYKIKDNAVITRGIVVLYVLIQMRLETEMRTLSPDDSYEENLKRFLKVSQKNFGDFFPLWMKMPFLDRFVLKRHMKRKVEEYQQKYPVERFNALALMKSFISTVLEKEDSLFCELYAAYSVEFITHPVPGRPEELTKAYGGKNNLNIIVDMGKVDGLKSAEVFISRPDLPKQKISIDSLTKLDISEDEVTPHPHFFRVQLSHANGPPEVVFFEERQTAESFVTCLETYYRLTVNFYQSLCPQLEPCLVKDINLVKAHGPVSTSYIQQKIEKQYVNNPDDVYILRKSLTEHDEYEVVRYVKKSKDWRVSSLGKLITTDEGYTFDEATPATKGLKKLMNDRIEEKEGLTNENSSRIHPKFEACDVLQEIFLKQETRGIHTEDGEEELRRQERENQPKVFMESDLQAHKFIDRGYFTEVFQSQLSSGEFVVMKRLRQSDIIKSLERLDCNTSEKLANLQAAFRESFQTLLKLNNPKYFLSFVGLSLSTPEAILLKKEKYNNLKVFLENRNRFEGCKLTMHHLQGITVQLADALSYMERKGCYHKNLHCGNIIVTKYVRQEMLVKIADPGMVSYYNKLSLDTVCNRNRLPWIAPEMYKNLQATSIRTEVFSYGMTLWQMYNEGQSPILHPCLNSKNVQEMCQFFSSPDFQLPCPLYLRVSDDDPVAIKHIKKDMFENIIRRCCSVNQEERPSPKEILRTLYSTINDFAQAYHDYNIIYDKDSTMSHNIGSSGSTLNSGGGTGETSGINSNTQHVAVPVHDMMKFTENRTDENTVPKVHMNSGGSESRAVISQSMIEPTNGAPLLMSPGNAQQPAIDHTVQPAREARGLISETIVSDIKFIIKEGRLSIDFNKTLGSGYYGKIYQGRLEPSSSAGISGHVNVAVKALKDDQAERYQKEFQKEASIMEKLAHPNIVKFYGIYREGKYMVMELVENGSLYQFVQSCKRHAKALSPIKMLQIGVDIAAGMEYLADMDTVHCDLAARNVLLTSDLQAKVSDFGLSKILQQEKDYYKRTKQRTIPILWCAPEWIGFSRFYSKSDVWSFGVVLWEIYSYGKTPLIGTETGLNKFYTKIFEGQRLSKPRECPDDVYSLMMMCWKYEVIERPSFKQIKSKLENIIENKMAVADKTIPPNKICHDSDETTLKVKYTRDCKTHHTDKEERVIEGGSDPSLQSNPSQKQPGLNLQPDPSKRSDRSLKSDESLHVNLNGSLDHDQQSDLNLQDTQGTEGESLSACLYRQANAEADFVEVEEENGFRDITDIPAINVGRIPVGASKTEPVRRVTRQQSSSVNDAFSAGSMTKKASTLTGSLIESGLIVDRQTALGQGRFGKVYSGKLHGKDVAIKTCSDECFRSRFKREYEIMQRLSHQNIVQVIGIHRPTANGHGMEYVMEFMGKGNLLSMLKGLKKQNNQLRDDQKISFLIQIAEGMEYLFSKFICHGDLKADNVLVNDRNVAKVSDFGLAKMLDTQDADSEYTRNGGLIKPYIASPETLDKRYTLYSDIWSYGILCLDVFRDGEPSNFPEPLDFNHVSSTGDCAKLFLKLKSRERFEKPVECPPDIYETILKCWEWVPRRRIQYIDIIQAFRSFLESRAQEQTS